MKKHFYIVAVIPLLTACSTHLIKHIPTMEADSPETGLEGLALSNELRRAFIQLRPEDNPFCNGTVPQHHDSETYTYSRYETEANERRDDPKIGKKSTAEQYKCIGFNPKLNSDPQARKYYIKAGFALTDYYCDIFFRRLALHASSRHYAGSVANDVGTAVAAVLGLAKAGSVATGATGVGFGLLDSGLRNYDATFLVTPDLAALQSKVISAQKDYANEVFGSLPDNIPESNSAIIRYANFCSFVGMKGLLNQALTDPTPVDMSKYVADYFKKAKEARDAAKAAEEAVEPADNSQNSADALDPF